MRLVLTTHVHPPMRSVYRLLPLLDTLHSMLAVSILLCGHLILVNLILDILARLASVVRTVEPYRLKATPRSAILRPSTSCQLSLSSNPSTTEAARHSQSSFAPIGPSRSPTPDVDAGLLASSQPLVPIYLPTYPSAYLL